MTCTVGAESRSAGGWSARSTRATRWSMRSRTPKALLQVGTDSDDHGQEHREQHPGPAPASTPWGRGGRCSRPAGRRTNRADTSRAADTGGGSPAGRPRAARLQAAGSGPRAAVGPRGEDRRGRLVGSSRAPVCSPCASSVRRAAVLPRDDARAALGVAASDHVAGHGSEPRAAQDPWLPDDHLGRSGWSTSGWRDRRRPSLVSARRPSSRRGIRRRPASPWRRPVDRRSGRRCPGPSSPGPARWWRRVTLTVWVVPSASVTREAVRADRGHRAADRRRQHRDARDGVAAVGIAGLRDAHVVTDRDVGEGDGRAVLGQHHPGGVDGPGPAVRCLQPQAGAIVGGHRDGVPAHAGEVAAATHLATEALAEALARSAPVAPSGRRSGHRTPADRPERRGWSGSACRVSCSTSGPRRPRP